MHPSHHARDNPDKVAIIMADSGQRITYGELDAGSNRVAQLMRAAGLSAGDGIAVMLENHPRFLELALGALRAGLYFTPIGSRLTTAEVEYIVNDCGARIFVTSAALADRATELELDRVERRYIVDGDVEGYERLETATDALPAEPSEDETAGQSMLYSSGTTGRPKGVRRALSGGPIDEPAAITLLLQGLWKVDAETVYLSPAPLYHAAPLGFNLAVLALGGTSVIMERFDPERALTLIAQHAVSHSQWVPTMFVRMLKLDAAARTAHDVSSLRYAIHAAAPCPIEIKERMLEWWGPIVHEYYAGTEGNGFCWIGPQDWLAHRGSVGKALVGVLHILDDDGQELPAGEAGAIYFESPAEFEYHNDPDKTRASRTAEGWSTLGDVGYVDEEGFLYLTDRKAHMIISGGVNVYPQEVENRLVLHPKVLDAAVIGVPDDEMGEEVKAVVQLADMADAGGALATELVAFCREELSGIKCPRSVDFVEELPRHPTGKLYKRLLRDRYWKDQGSRRI